MTPAKLEALTRLAEAAEESGVKNIRIETSELQELLFLLNRTKELKAGVEEQCERIRKWWFAAMKRTLPDEDQGVGISCSTGELESGELELNLDVYGIQGTCYLSKEMWLTWGVNVGWVSEEAWEAAMQAAGMG